MSNPDPEKLPGKGLFGWLGRQIGYVSGAVKRDVGAPRTIYKQQKVEERPLPQQPNVTLRRTTIDEVVQHHDRKS
ncbi:MAG TPA: hypothetical protein VGN72_19190 [Tepidisphaeraceae bacterium]|nr:hypothetical protein [Tepidisphaeraceae bacterium]